MRFRNTVTGEIREWDCVQINSALVSAQNRNRLYWTNIPDVTQPGDKGLLFADIREHGADTPNSEGWHTWFEANKEFQLKKKYQKGNFSWILHITGEFSGIPGLLIISSAERITFSS